MGETLLVTARHNWKNERNNAGTGVRDQVVTIPANQSLRYVPMQQGFR